MSDKNKPAVKAATKTPDSKAIPAKYDRPKILLIDVGDKSAQALIKEGHNVSVGTFGTPYKVPKGAGYQPVIVKASLPNYTEQEVLIVDTMPDEFVDNPPGEKSRPNEELDWWAKCSHGVIDPRSRAMVMVQDQFSRILSNGGTFIIFADNRDSQELVWAQSHGRYDFSIERELPYDNWSFLSLLSNLEIAGDHGEEMKPINEEWPLVRLLSDHLKDGSFSCTLEPNWQLKDQWIALAKNKFGSVVAGAIAPQEKTKSGWIFIFPRISRRDEFLASFIKNILPNFCPLLFPHWEGKSWIYRKEYELPSVLSKVGQISEIQDEAARKVEVLEKAIQAERDENQYLYHLISETGTGLVDAIKKALSVLGFVSVVDVDEEMKKAGKTNSLREDLRIHDQSPTLIVDIKGVAGKPADAEALQSQKHAFIFIQEQNRADVRGLTIINHQRLLPPLERENDMPFRREILDNAEQVKLGLMTGWDLFRLVRGFIQNKWESKYVIPLFYHTGRIFPIPCHYEYIGKVKQVWKAAFSVELDHGEIRIEERIALEFPVDFNEQQVTSLRLNNDDVEVAMAKCEVGILRDEALPRLKPGMVVYRINLLSSK